jgi:hypothetical protein
VISLGHGLLTPDAERAVIHLRSAADQLEGLGMRVQHGRLLLELGAATRAAGGEPADIFRRAKEILVGCDANLYVPMADDALAG